MNEQYYGKLSILVTRYLSSFPSFCKAINGDYSKMTILSYTEELAGAELKLVERVLRDSKCCSDFPETINKLLHKIKLFKCQFGDYAGYLTTKNQPKLPEPKSEDKKYIDADKLSDLISKFKKTGLKGISIDAKH